MTELIISLEKQEKIEFKRKEAERIKRYRQSPKGQEYYRRIKEKKRQKYRENKEYREKLKAEQREYINKNKEKPEYIERRKKIVSKHQKKIGQETEVLRKTVPNTYEEVKRALSLGNRIGSVSEHDIKVSAIGIYEDSETLYEMICDNLHDSNVQLYFEDFFNL